MDFFLFQYKPMWLHMQVQTFCLPSFVSIENKLLKLILCISPLPFRHMGSFDLTGNGQKKIDPGLRPCSPECDFFISTYV